jgi:hypothetical protein
MYVYWQQEESLIQVEKSTKRMNANGTQTDKKQCGIKIHKLQCTIKACISTNMKVRIFKISKTFLTFGAKHVCHSLFFCYGQTIILCCLLS